MQLMTISEVSKAYPVTPRMLRHYEKMGLLESLHIEGYAYRMYDEDAVMRLQQIVLLRKLRIPLKQIALALDASEPEQIAAVLQENIAEINQELSALDTVRNVLELFMQRLRRNADLHIRVNLLQDAEVVRIMDALSLSKNNLKEERSMDQLNRANETLGKLRKVRIVMLPPCTVASYHFIGENPEETVGGVMDRFVRESGLYAKKPDARMFGFNHPNPSAGRPHHGYEDWVIIPDDMEVPAPLVKKKFAGGMYAAHTIAFPDFHEWDLLIKWAEESDKYMPAFSERGEEIMGGCLEEHLNWVYMSHLGWPEDSGVDGQLDLLLPVALR